MARDKRFGWRGLVGGLILIPFAILTLFSEPWIREGTWTDFFLDGVAYGIFVAGVVFRFWATLYIGGRKEKTVVNEGAYSVCRNPLYVGSLLLAISTGLFLKSLFFAAGIGFILIFYILATVPAEEDFLRLRLGGPYIQYCQTVPRFLPRFSLFRSPLVIEVDLGALRRECKRALLWIWFPLAGELIAHLRGEAWWPHWMRLF